MISARETGDSLRFSSFRPLSRALRLTADSPGADAPGSTLPPAPQAWPLDLPVQKLFMVLTECVPEYLPMPQTLRLRSDTMNDGHVSVPQMVETPAGKFLQRVRSGARTDSLVVDEIHQEAHLVSDIACPAPLSDQEQ